MQMNKLYFVPAVLGSAVVSQISVFAKTVFLLTNSPNIKSPSQDLAPHIETSATAKR